MQNTDRVKPFIFYSDKLNFKSVDGLKGKEYWVEGYISTGDMDLVNDVVTKSCMNSMLGQFDHRSIKLDYEHESWRGDDPFSTEAAKTRMPLGKAIKKNYDDKGVSVKWKMNPSWKKFDQKGNVVMDFKELWSSVEDGFLDSFSIAYVPTRTQNVSKMGKTIRMLDDVHLLNVALTGNPINPAATMSAVMAKSLEFMNEKDEEIDMSEIEIKGSLDKLDEAVEELKTKYKKRWRGRDGRYHYEYADKPGDKKPKKEKESLTREGLSKEAEEQGLDGDDLVGYVEDRMEGLSSSEALDKVREFHESKPKKESDKKPSKESSKKIDKEKITEMREIVEEVSTSDLQGVASANASKLIGVKPSEARKDKKKQQALNEAEDVLLDYANGDRDLEDAQVAIQNIREYIGKKSHSPGQKASEEQMGCKSMTEEEKQPEAPPEAPEESGQEAEGQEASTESTSEGEKPEGKSMTLRELKSSVIKLQEQLKSLEKENKDLKAIVEKPQQKSKGAESNERKSRDQDIKMHGPMDIL